MRNGGRDTNRPTHILYQEILHKERGFWDEKVTVKSQDQ